MNFRPPDNAVVRMATPIRELGEATISNRTHALRGLGKWESDIEALNLIALSATHAVAVTTLAQTSTSLLPSAIPVARATMESGVRALWLLAPENPFEREARWLVHLEHEMNVQKRLAHSNASTNMAVIRDFVDGVRSKLPPGTAAPKGLPSVEQMLESIGMPEKYVIYTFLSQTAHATHHGTSHFRKHLGTMKILGDFTSSEDWWLPLSTTWWFLAVPLRKFAEHHPALGLDLLPMDLQKRFVAADMALRKSHG